MSNNDVSLVVEFCKKNFNLSDAKLGDEYYYSSIPLCILDAIFSIGVKYISTKNVVRRYCSYYNIPIFRSHSDYLKVSSQHTVSQFVDNVKLIGLDKFTDEILKNHQRTSTVNGILKSEAALHWALILKSFEIETYQDLNEITTKTMLELEKALISIQGQGSRISLNYFKMLCGDDNLIKPDRHIINFLSHIINRTVSPSDSQYLIARSVETLSKEFPNLSSRLLDYTIWNYMSRSK